MNPVAKEVTRERERQAWNLKARGRTKAQSPRSSGSPLDGHQLLARVEARELKRMSRRVLRLRARQHAQLDHVIAEAMAAWAASEAARRDDPRRTREARRPAGADGARRRTETRTTRKAEGQSGEPRFLAACLEALAAQRRLCGASTRTRGPPRSWQPQPPAYVVYRPGRRRQGV